MISVIVGVWKSSCPTSDQFLEHFIAFSDCALPFCSNLHLNFYSLYFISLFVIKEKETVPMG